MERILYTNNEAVAHELMCLKRTERDLNTLRDNLLSKGVNVSEIVLIEATKGNVSFPVQAYKEVETNKIKAIINQFGETAITDGWETKVNEKVKQYESDLSNVLFELWRAENNLYLDYFDIDENGIKLKSGVDKNFFEKKNSIKLNDENSAKFEKIKSLCLMLNEILYHPDNEFEAMDEILYFNPDEKEFEIKVSAFGNKEVFEFMKVRKEMEQGHLYNLSQRRNFMRGSRL
ncbi:hypothetical protein TRIP_D170022 [uncultured Paludibacter sp.]|uniref:Uncharacterized protein n=1 Tax=uncultured Paludibacter sp. TaxID=497635 RepID=A0A653A657_9BACT|nr:hypothetical protein TRIP_D170022 [uncultured Paludibacter sp.]